MRKILLCALALASPSFAEESRTMWCASLPSAKIPVRLRVVGDRELFGQVGKGVAEGIIRLEGRTRRFRYQVESYYLKGAFIHFFSTKHGAHQHPDFVLSDRHQKDRTRFVLTLGGHRLPVRCSFNSP